MKKLIAIALVLVLMLGVLPGAAFADDGVEASAPAASGDSGSAGSSGSGAGSSGSEAGSSGSEAGSSGSGAGSSGSEAGSSGSEAGSSGSADGASGSDAGNNAPAAENNAPAAENNAPAAPVAPEKPSAPAEPNLDGLSAAEANSRIEAYNQAVETYNAEIETYNAELENYREAVAIYNARVEQFNAEAEVFNAEAEEHNKAEQEKLAAYEGRMEEYNKRLEIYNKNVQTIATISERNTAKIEPQMEQLGDIGRVDKESIKALGTVLEEDYVVKYGRREVSLGKAGDLVISWDALKPTDDRSTIKVEAAEKSGQTYKVANLHIFQDFKDVYEMSEYQEALGWDCMNINIDDANGVIIIPAALIDRMVMMEYEVALVDANDSVTVSSQNAVFSATPNLMTPRFLEGFTDGNCWYNDNIFASNAGISDTDWTGTSHTFSFAGGTSDRAEIKNPLNVNRYFFNRYNNPEPVAPDAFEPDIVASRDLLNILTAEGVSLEALSRMALRQLPAVIPYNPAPVPAPDPDPVEPDVSQPDPDEPEVIDEPEVPQAKPDEPAVEAEIVPLIAFIETEEILPEEIPMAGAGSWALLNLIAAVLSVLIAAAMLMGRKQEDGNEDEEAGWPASVRVCGALVAATSIILFVLTENMRLHMVLTDSWTPVMLVLFTVNAVLAMAGSRREEKEAA